MITSAFTVPFTEQYARESVARQFWHNAVFREKNRAISLLWAGVIAAIAVCHLAAGALAASMIAPGQHPGGFALNWALPVVLARWAVRRTQRIAAAQPDRQGC